ncbi:MAG TPA: TonB-dependent receptor [Holophagaceae bacterium]|nr:TonB-dependent receptor [Geothrix sp.]HJW33166.1 TonB-dependent receptor [Holophagaceae bacterium]
MPRPRLSLALILGLGSCALMSQEPPKKDELQELEDLLNTPIQGASKREQRLIDSPQAIEVLTGDEIRLMGIYKLSDALKIMTSVDVHELDNAATNVTLRGAMQQGQPKTVQILIDNVPLYNAAASSVDIDNLPVSIDLIDKVEVVRGPSSSLYGANAVVGVIAITTRKGKDGLKAGARASQVTDGTHRGTADIAYGNQVFGVSAGYQGASFQTTKQSTYFFSNLAPVTLDNNKSHQYNASIRLDWSYGKGAIWGGYGEASKYYATYKTAVFPYQKSETGILYAGWGHSWLESLRTEVRYSETTQQAVVGPAPLALAVFGDPKFQDEYTWIDFKSKLLEVQVNWDILNTLHLVGGGDRRTYSAEQALFIGFLGEQKESASGGFLNLDWNATPALNLSGGVRVENESLGGSRKSPRAAVVWNPTKSSSLRAGWYSATRSPQILESRVDFTYVNAFPAPPLTGVLRILPNPSLEPEKVTSSELGYRHLFGAFNVDLTLFEMKFQKLIAQVPIGNVIAPPYVYANNQYQNTGDAKNRGMELALSYRPSTKLAYGANATWLDYKLEATDTRPSYAPAFKANAWVRFTADRLSGYFSFQHIGPTTMEYIPAAGPAAPLRPRTQINQLNANLAYQVFAGFSVSAYTRNILKEDYNDQGSGTPTRSQFVYSARRESGITLGYRF